MGHIEGVSREQKLLFPDVVDDYIDEGNPVRFIDAFVDGLDLEELGFERSEAASTGRPPYHPSDLLNLYIYGYLNCVRSNGYLPGMQEGIQTALQEASRVSRLDGEGLEGEASTWVAPVGTAYAFSVSVRQSRSNLSFDPRTTSMFEVVIDGFVASMGLNIAS